MKADVDVVCCAGVGRECGGRMLEGPGGADSGRKSGLVDMLLVRRYSAQRKAGCELLLAGYRRGDGVW